MRTVNLVLLLVAVVLSITTLGCGGSSDAAMAPDTTSGGYVTRSEFESFQDAQKNNWQGNSKTLADHKSKIMENTRAIAAYGQQLENLRSGSGSGSNPSSTSRDITGFSDPPSGRDPSSGSNSGNAGTPNLHSTGSFRTMIGSKWFRCTPESENRTLPVEEASPGIFAPTPPAILELVEKHFGESKDRQEKILAKQDETKELIIGGFKRIEGKLTEVGQRVADLEKTRHPASMAPASEPEMKADK